MGTLDVDGHAIKVTNLDKILYPDDGTTKYDVVRHYLAVADPILAQLADRPVTRKRWPDGVEAKPFFEKNVPRGTPDWVRQVELASPGSTRDRDHVVYPVLDSRAGLVWVANLAALELHTPQWTVGPRGGVHDADRLVIDLDPGEPAGLAECVEVAHMVREVLEGEGFTTVPVTSGSKGMQMYASHGEAASAESFSERAHELAKTLERDRPDLVLSQMRRDLRPGKVLLDWSQNNRAKTTITPYSLRGRSESWVATPRSWEELEDPSSVEQVHRRDMPERLEAYGELMETLDG